MGAQVQIGDLKRRAIERIAERCKATAGRKTPTQQARILAAHADRETVLRTGKEEMK